MVSALESQLASGASLNSALLLNARRHRHYGYSYLFDAKEAADQDLDSIFALAQNGYAALCILEPKLAESGDVLFSHAARNIDRATLPPEQLSTLKDNLSVFMRRLATYLLEPPAAKVIEWLVRRFRINEFDVTLVLECFLPYHDTVQFAKMLSILVFEASSPWHFMDPWKKNTRPLPREALIDRMVKNEDIARFVLQLSPRAVEDGTLHRTLSNFTTSVAIAYITQLPEINESVLAFLLPSITEPLTNPVNKEVILANFVILSALAQRVELSTDAFKAITKDISRIGKQVTIRELFMVFSALYAPREDVPPLSKKLLKVLKKPSKVVNLVPESLAWRGGDKLYIALVSLILKQDPKGHTWTPLILSLVNSEIAPPNFIEQLTVLFLNAVDIRDVSEFYTQVLSAVCQRWPEVFRKATTQHAARLSEDDAETFDRLTANLSLGLSATGVGGSLLALNSENEQTRLLGLRDVLESLGADDLEPAALGGLQDRLVDCLHDPSALIIDLVYASPDLLLRRLPGPQILSSVKVALSQTDVPLPVLHKHFEFLSSHYCAAHPEDSFQIFCEIFAPFILFSTPRREAAKTAWSSIKRSTLKDLPLLRGTIQHVASDGTTEQMGTINLAISETIASNMIGTNSEIDTKSLDFFLGCLASSDASARNLAFLVIRRLLPSLPNDKRICLALRVLRKLGPVEMDDMASSKDFKPLKNFTDVQKISEMMASEPDGVMTRRLLQANLLVVLSAVQRPSQGTIDWLRVLPAEENKDLVSAYVALCRTIYTLANSVTRLSPLSIHLLRQLFSGMKDETLLFLAGVWSAPADAGNDPVVQRVALNHAKAFLIAQSRLDPTQAANFQAIVPSLLIALRSPEKATRALAAECVQIIKDIRAEPRQGWCYAMDTIYGDRSSGVQILKASDSTEYFSAIVEHRDNFTADPEYLSVFHRELFSGKGKGKVSKSYRKRIVCYLLSHALCWANGKARLQLIQSVQDVADAAKITLLKPLLEDAFLKQEIPSELQNPQDVEAYYQALIQIFDQTSASVLDEAESEEWNLLCSIIRKTNDPSVSERIRDVPLLQLRRHLYPHLSDERKVEISALLLDLAHQAADAASYTRIKRVLSDLVNEAYVATVLLTMCCLPVETHQEPPAKRAKTDDTTPPTSESIPKLQTLVEIIASNPPSNSPEMVACLFEVMHKLCQSQAATASALDFSRQLLLTALDKTIGSLSGTVIPPGTLKLEVLIELIRTSDNPQTFQQALLVISTAARLVPDSVLHGVMPIFTFMGSNMFHRDDSYSFRVVQKTIDSVVPIMVKSLQDTYGDRIELLIGEDSNPFLLGAGVDNVSGSRVFLRVFTDAAFHIPRHRRSHFYTHLISVLGPKTFFAPVAMLLVEKSATRIVRQDEEEQIHTLSVPLAALAKHPHSLRLDVLCEILEECERLASKIGNTDNSSIQSFLELNLDEHSPSADVALKKQVVALLIYVGHVIHAFSDRPRYRPDPSTPDMRMQRLVYLLVQLAGSKHGKNIPEFDDIHAAVRRALVKTLSVVPAADFVRAVASLLSIQDTGGDAPIEIVLRATNAIGTTAQANEAESLAQCIQPVLDVALRPGSSIDALAVLATLTYKLGPRLISSVSSMVDACVISLQLSAESVNEDLRSSGLQLFSSLVKTIPALLGQDLDRIILSCLPFSAHDHSVANDVLETITAKVPSRALLTSLPAVWSSIQAGVKAQPIEEVTTFFQFSKAVLESASRAEIVQNIKGLFHMFLDAFDVRKRFAAEVVPELEMAIVAAFLQIVTALNEASFKPLFRRLYDWAFSDGNGDALRQTTFSSLMLALLQTFKAHGIIDLFNAFSQGTTRDADLWLSLLKMMHTSMVVDDGVFWRDDRLERLLPSFVKQITCTRHLPLKSHYRHTDPNTSKTQLDIAEEVLSPCFSTFAHIITREELLNSFNRAILMETRTEESHGQQLLALRVLTAVWKREGSRTISFAAETLTFIADLAESPTDSVAREARAFKALMDSMTGLEA
ncbi:snoRNA-binding rRNA-processing protein utp10 [Tulasnella sp. 403]|nr:snoRNA-binding rRNA-processing protein utp10 [Tulasnella sp. 403]